MTADEVRWNLLVDEHLRPKVKAQLPWTSVDSPIEGRILSFNELKGTAFVFFWGTYGDHVPIEDLSKS